MFIHSIKAPRFYKQAAVIAKKVKEDGASIKVLIYEKKHPNIKGLYALVIETLQRQSQLDFLLKKSKLFEKEPRFDQWLARVLITELLWGKKRLPGESKPVKTVLAYEQILKAHMTDVHGCDRTNQVRKPRYVRVNTLKLSLSEAVESFRDEGWTFSQYLDGDDYAGFLERVAGMSDDEFLVDIHLDNLLVFPANAQFYKHPAYLDGQIILQDKASCLPVQILNASPGSIALDMCAAPGMKTTQLAAQMNNEGSIFAVEMDAKRLETLNKMLESAGVTCVTVLNKDVVTVTDKDIPGVEYILVDPTCSGSGIVNRLEVENNFKPLEQRVAKLAGFQIKILKHALKRFPDAKRVVYSTCSVYPQENEDVIAEVISSCTKYKLVPVQNLLKAPWPNLASTEEGSVGSHCIYARPEDGTNGFFVAAFERLAEGEKNVFLKERTYQMEENYGNENGFGDPGKSGRGEGEGDENGFDDPLKERTYASNHRMEENYGNENGFDDPVNGGGEGNNYPHEEQITMNAGENKNSTIGKKKRKLKKHPGENNVENKEATREEEQIMMNTCANNNSAIEKKRKNKKKHSVEVNAENREAAREEEQIMMNTGENNNSTIGKKKRNKRKNLGEDIAENKEEKINNSAIGKKKKNKKHSCEDNVEHEEATQQEEQIMANTGGNNNSAVGNKKKNKKKHSGEGNAENSEATQEEEQIMINTGENNNPAIAKKQKNRKTHSGEDNAESKEATQEEKHIMMNTGEDNNSTIGKKKRNKRKHLGEDNAEDKKATPEEEQNMMTTGENNNSAIGRTQKNRKTHSGEDDAERKEEQIMIKTAENNNSAIVKKKKNRNKHPGEDNAENKEAQQEAGTSCFKNKKKKQLVQEDSKEISHTETNKLEDHVGTSVLCDVELNTKKKKKKRKIAADDEEIRLETNDGNRKRDGDEIKKKNNSHKFPDLDDFTKQILTSECKAVKKMKNEDEFADVDNSTEEIPTSECVVVKKKKKKAYSDEFTDLDNSIKQILTSECKAVKKKRKNAYSHENADVDNSTERILTSESEVIKKKDEFPVMDNSTEQILTLECEVVKKKKKKAYSDEFPDMDHSIKQILTSECNVVKQKRKNTYSDEFAEVKFAEAPTPECEVVKKKNKKAHSDEFRDFDDYTKIVPTPEYEVVTEKKKKKAQPDEFSVVDNSTEQAPNSECEVKKKKKNRAQSDEFSGLEQVTTCEVIEIKKKKKSGSQDVHETDQGVVEKKGRKQDLKNDYLNSTNSNNPSETCDKVSKKKKRKTGEYDDDDDDVSTTVRDMCASEGAINEEEVTEKAKEKRKSRMVSASDGVINNLVVEEVTKKGKKKRKSQMD